MDVLILQAQISYKELLELLITDFLNPIDTTTGVRDITVVAVAGANPTTCSLNQLQLAFAGTATSSILFGKMHRMIRLLRTGKLTTYQWDVLLRSMKITQLDDSSSIEGVGMAQAFDISSRLNMTPEQMATWWSDVDTHHYINYDSNSNDTLPSVYDSIFNNKSVINDPTYNTIFNDPTVVVTNPYYGNTSQIATACRLAENDVILILNYL